MTLAQAKKMWLSRPYMTYRQYKRLKEAESRLSYLAWKYGGTDA